MKFEIVEIVNGIVNLIVRNKKGNEQISIISDRTKVPVGQVWFIVDQPVHGRSWSRSVDVYVKDLFSRTIINILAGIYAVSPDEIELVPFETPTAVDF